jgi:hypothetical protein
MEATSSQRPTAPERPRRSGGGVVSTAASLASLPVQITTSVIRAGGSVVANLMRGGRS